MTICCIFIFYSLEILYSYKFCSETRKLSFIQESCIPKIQRKILLIEIMKKKKNAALNNYSKKQYVFMQSICR